MKIHQLTRKQFLPITLSAAWQFFSTPHNLARITPPSLKFRIISISGNESEIYSGQIIRYKITIIPLVTVGWTTKISHVRKPVFFADNQQSGPYALWHHEHHFHEVAGGVEMTDVVHYAIPFGLIGRLTHSLFVKEKVNAIFDYRYQVLEKIFPCKTDNTIPS